MSTMSMMTWMASLRVCVTLLTMLFTFVLASSANAFIEVMYELSAGFVAELSTCDSS